ncbi:hypothetical protein [Methanolapillus millepedarum]|uniref:hypothetical protein n=1 Tax=Methanolapillus millepedarum TaxID=3028296 RepID=UPI0030B888FD
MGTADAIGNWKQQMQSEIGNSRCNLKLQTVGAIGNWKQQIQSVSEITNWNASAYGNPQNTNAKRLILRGGLLGS